MSTSPERSDGTDAAASVLPELTDDRIEAIEARVFAGIAADRRHPHARPRRRRGAWIVAGAAAAIVVVAAVIAPAVGRITSQDTSEQSAVAPAIGVVEGAVPLSGGSIGGEAPSLSDVSGGAGARDASVAGDATREIVATGNATVLVDDVAAAIARIAEIASSAGGYTESSTVGGAGGVVPIDGGPGDSLSPSAGSSADGGWIAVRVPSEQLPAIMDDLSAIGEVTASSVSRQDVTDQAVDLRARIDAAQTSVTRLTELMAQAASTADLLAAESALAERQATLESYQQQLAALEGQVEMSSLSVSVQPRTVAVTADPAGFGDGLAAGWNGLVATLNGIVVALGFLLPWIVIAAIIAAIVWGARSVLRRRRSRESTPD